MKKEIKQIKRDKEGKVYTVTETIEKTYTVNIAELEDEIKQLEIEIERETKPKKEQLKRLKERVAELKNKAE
jgi:uncharacterized protein involved in exopolysaccharide biosynthesis